MELRGWELTTRRFDILSMMTSDGTSMLTTKFIETSSSSFFACPCVRGNPSRRKLAEGRPEEFDGEGEAEMSPAAWVGFDSRYPRRESSPTMSLTMRES